ncbi:MAG: fasciclin domain-containing protein, partial [Myxococcota bacterium]
MATALDQTGLLATLDDASQSLTVFAPVDAAFNTLPNDVIASSNFVSTGDPGLLNIGVSDAELTTILQAHVVPGAQDAAAVTGASTLDSLASGSVITVTNVDPTPENRPGDEMDTFPVLSGRVQLLQTDIVASNGVIHVVDAVFIPSADPFPGNLFELIEATPLFQPFFALLRAAGLDSTIADFNTDDVQNTVFMPAFGLEGAESADTARGHVFPGTTLASAVVAAAGTDIENTATLARYAIGADGPTIEGTTIAFTDLRASNGVVHLTLGPVSQPDDTVADIITTTGDLSSLRDALTAIEPDGSEFDPETSTQSLLDVLRADEMTTLFAPNNAAFAALAGIDVDLNGDEPEDDPEDDMDITDNAAELIALGELDEVLTYHVTPAGTVVNAMSADGDFATRNGSTATLGRFTIGTSTVLTVNGYIEVVSSLRTANGSMVHTIGNVLVPGGLSTLPVLNENFPGSSQEAIEYFTFFTGYAGLTDNSFPISLTAGSGTETFGGTLSDLLSFIAGDDSFEVGMGEDFAGQLIAPYSVDTNDDGTPDANFTIPEVTVFVPVT